MSDFRRRLLMELMAPREQLIYSLSDYTCDGTVNTFIDTGIRLFTPEYESFRIELEYDNFDLQTQVSQETILECKSNIPLPASVISPGLTIRAGIYNQYEGDHRGMLEVNCAPLFSSKYYGNASTASVSFIYGSNSSLTVNGDSTQLSGTITYHANTLTVGGRYANDGTPGRFPACHIRSLKIYVVPVTPGGNTIYMLKDYTCDGTAATAINTGLYLFDSSVYSTGWIMYSDFTIGENNVGNGSYLRCRNSASPYPGIAVRRNNSNANQMQAQLNSKSNNVSASSGTRHNLIVTNDLTTWKMVINDSINISDSPSTVISPFVIGGELSNDTTQEWNSSRFSKIYIHTLIVRAL